MARNRSEQPLTALRFVSEHFPLAVLFFLALALCPTMVHAQADSGSQLMAHSATALPPDVCRDTTVHPALQEALRLVCLREHSAGSVQKAIVVAFVGGFVKPDDSHHPEVLFARYLRDRYGSPVHVTVFSNHDEKTAVHDTIELFTANDSGRSQKQPPRIIAYGHSWGASEVVTFARDLGKRGIPVQLTIQMDSVRKFGGDDHTIPPNVVKAVNFYQTRGFTPGQKHIVATEGAHTEILGNFHITYRDHQINYGNYKWFSRVFNKHHHEIENDPRVWEQVAELIDSQVAPANATSQAASSAPLSSPK